MNFARRQTVTVAAFVVCLAVGCGASSSKSLLGTGGVAAGGTGGTGGSARDAGKEQDVVDASTASDATDDAAANDGTTASDASTNDASTGSDATDASVDGAAADAHPSTDAAAPACTPGEVRCGSSGNRQRCGDARTWTDESYVCTVKLAGSSDNDVMCALKADGTINCWATGPVDGFSYQQGAMLRARAPQVRWRDIAVSDGQGSVCGLDMSGAMACWSTIYDQPPPVLSGTFKALVTSIYGTCGVSHPGGTLVCSSTGLLPDAVNGPYAQITLASDSVYGLTEDGALHAPSYVKAALPPGPFRELVSNNQLACVIDFEGRISCYSGDAASPPPPADLGFRGVALDYHYQHACAIKADGTLTCWTVRAGAPDLTPPAGRFVQIAAEFRGMCAIAVDGTTACWAPPAAGGFEPPAGW